MDGDGGSGTDEFGVAGMDGDGGAGMDGDGGVGIDGDGVAGTDGDGGASDGFGIVIEVETGDVLVSHLGQNQFCFFGGFLCTFTHPP